MGILSSHGTAQAKAAQDRTSHWSKDFVEHLRAVHFALIVVAAVLVATGADTTSSRTATALTQIQRIAAFEQQSPVIADKVYKQALLDAKIPLDWSVLVGLDWYNHTSSTEELHIPRATLWTVNAYGILWSKTPPTELSTLSDFVNFWNSLAEGVDLYLPLRPSHSDRCYLYGAILLNRLSSGCEVNPNSIPNGPGPDAYQEFIFRLQKPIYSFNDNRIISLVAISTGKHPEPLDGMIEIPLKTEQARITESYLKKLFFTDVKLSGRFDVAFPELNSLSSGLSALPIGDAVHRIETQVASSQKTISLLGVNVPIQQLAQWGLFLLLAVQFYFWLHLHELSKRIEPGDDGWDVAWIGIYRTRVALFAAIISCFVMPLAASATLAHRLTQIPFYYRRSMIAVSVTAVVLSVGLGLLTLWRLVLLRRCSPVKSQSAESDAV